MSRQLSSLLKISVAGFALLIVGACKPADKGQGALKSADMKALNLDRANSSVFGKYFAIDDCEADEMEALGALAGLGLGENGAGGVSFARRDIQNGIVTYEDLVVTTDNKDSFSAKEATFHCPQMEDEGPIFARLDMKETKISDDNAVFRFATLSVAKPTHDAAKSLVDGIVDPRANNSGQIGFGGLSFTGVSVEGDEMSGTLSAMAWGETLHEDLSRTADLMLEDVDLTISGTKGAQDISFKFEGMSARNFNMSENIAPNNIRNPAASLGGLVSKMNTFKRPYDELVMGKLNIDSEGFTIDFDGIEGQTSESGSVITTRQTLKPLIINVKPALGEMSDFKQAYDILKSLEFEEIVLSGSSETRLDSADDSIKVSDGLFVMKDAFRLNFEYEAEGLEATRQNLQSSLDAGNNTTDLSMLDALKLRSLRMTLEDNSIVERGLKLAGEMTGQDPKMIKRSLGMAVFAVALAAENEVQAEVFTESVEAFADFVKNGGTLTIEANPPVPFPLTPLVTSGGEDIDPKTLGFSASQHNDAP